MWETVGMSFLNPKCLRVPCPKCGANIGNACQLFGKFEGGIALPCHPERIALSKEDVS